MNLLEIPQFGREKDFIACIKQLLVRAHGGFLWMERPIPIDVDLISKIIGIPTNGMKPK
jgi:hypothetical protein